MAQVWTDAEEKLLKQDPLHDVKDEMAHSSPRLKHVDLSEVDAPGDQMHTEDVVKSHVPDAFADELKKDHGLTKAAVDLGGSEAEFMEDDPLHNVKLEMEHHSPHLRHVESPYSPGHQQPSSEGDVVKSDVPPAFEEELKSDHNIVKRPHEESDLAKEEEDAANPLEFSSRNVRDALLLRGRPMYRISANVGNRPLGPATTPETAIMCMKDEADDDQEEAPRVAPVRGTPHYRISAHHGMRPGGPLSRDLKSEATTEISFGDGAGADLSAETKPKGPGLPSRGGLSTAGPRRGGLARTGSGVPGEQRGMGSLARTGSGVPSDQRGGGGGLARTGSGVPGAGGLARTGSGVPGNSLARQGSGAFGGLSRTGSGIPSSKGGNNDLKDFSSFLDSADFKQEEA